MNVKTKTTIVSVNILSFEIWHATKNSCQTPLYSNENTQINVCKFQYFTTFFLQKL